MAEPRPAHAAATIRRPDVDAGQPRAVVVTCEGLSKSFALVDKGSAWRLAFGALTGVAVFDALTDVTFDVPKGQFVGILGRNGAGKSTLLRVIGGVYAADSGHVAVNGALSGLYELGTVGNPELTGRIYAQRLLTVHGFNAGARKAMIDDIHDFSELGDRFDDPVLTYSTGMTARLFFATATAGRYDVYLLDEILSVGDQHFQSKCWRRLRDRVVHGASGVLVTHDWSAIIKLCETAHILDKGSFVFSGPPERAARLYLYGDASQQPTTPGFARFVRKPADTLTARPGEDLLLQLEVEIAATADVGIDFAIERLEPGHGWEISLMSRTFAPVGGEPGRYAVDILTPRLPLDPGRYQVSVHLVMANPELRTSMTVLDGFGWLDGNGIALTVEGEDGSGLTLPTRWMAAAS